MAKSKKPAPPAARKPPAPPPADPAEWDRFTREKERAPRAAASAAATAAATASAAGRKLVPRARGEDRQRVVGYVPPALGQRLGVHCLVTGATISDVIETALREWLDANGRTLG